MKYPSWNEFKGKYPRDPEGAFEALCRLLFRTKYGIGDSLPYFYNNPGVETVPVKVGEDVIGYQSKFFEGETINDSQATVFINSLKTTLKHYANDHKVKITKIILYTNSVFWFPQPDKEVPERQKKIEKLLDDNGIAYEWMFGDNILDVVSKNELACDLFFDLYSNISKLPVSVKKQNERNFRNIDSTIKYSGQEIRLDRNKYISELSEMLSQEQHVLITGESGSGKSAVLKKFWEMLPEEDNAFYMLNGIQFGSASVDDLFKMDEAYTLAGFKSFYAGTTQKVLYIDSAEHLLELLNQLPLQTTLDELAADGWKFVFSCKTVFAERLTTLLSKNGITVAIINVGPLDEGELDEILNQYQIPSPRNEKVKKQIRIPFYLARYCELDLEKTDDMASFRDSVWDKKVRGTTPGAAQQKREECLIRIVREQQAKRTYLITIPDLDHDAAYALEKEDVITNYGYRGYAIKHDIYTDWTLDYIIARDFDTQEHCLEVLKKTPQSLSFTNAFKRWLTVRIDKEDETVARIVDAFMTANTDKQWDDSILSCIGSSELFASRFFTKYDVKLKANSFDLFTRFVDVLHVSCQEVKNLIEFNGKKYPITVPSGKGWDETIAFLYANKEVYYLEHLNTVYNVLDAYTRLGYQSTERKKAAELSLFLFDEIAKKRQAGEHFWLDAPKPWCVLVCTYAVPIHQQLKDRFRQVVEHRWVRHKDPYAELVAFILRDCEYISTLYPVCTACLEEVVALMELIWREQPPKEEKHAWPFRSDHENDYNNDYWFGLNKDFDNGLNYFPSSGFQTPMVPLLVAEKNYHSEELPVISFLVKFIDDCIGFYSKRCTQNHEEVETIVVQTSKGKHELLSSFGLWTLYRGLGNITAPHLIESLHMALETFLLDLFTGAERDNQENRKYVHKILGYILEHSHSVSLYAVVASIAMVEPHEFYDELLTVCQDIRFLSYDMSRHSCERVAGFMTAGLPRHQQMNEERKKSNNYPHRKTYLERILLDRQIVYDEIDSEDAKKKLERAYSVVDSLKKQVNDMDPVPMDYEFILARLDYREMEKEEVRLKDGREAVQLTPKLTQQMRQAQQVTQQNMERMTGVNLHVWIEKMFEGDEKTLSGLDYGKDVHQVLDDIRTIENRYQAEDKEPMYLKWDEYAPYMGSAVLLMRKERDLTAEEKEECWERVMKALRSPGFLVAPSMTGINICLSALPSLIAIHPEQEGLFSAILATYAKIKDEYVNTRICDLVSSVIESGNLWGQYPKMMENALELLHREVSKNDKQGLTPELAIAVLCLLTVKTDKRDLGNQCVEAIAALWKPRPHHRTLERTYHDADLVARYILNAPICDVDKLIAPYAKYFDAEHDYETLLTAVLVYAVNNDRYENFWRVWYALMEPLKRTARWFGNSQVVNTYLLNPPYLSPASVDWFKLEEKDLAFFENVVEDMANHPAVLNALSNVFTTFGKPYAKQGLVLFSKIVDTYGQQTIDESVKTSVIMNLEQFMVLIHSRYEEEIRREMEMNKRGEKLLRFMIRNGSQMAASMIEKL